MHTGSCSSQSHTRTSSPLSALQISQEMISTSYLQEAGSSSWCSEETKHLCNFAKAARIVRYHQIQRSAAKNKWIKHSFSDFLCFCSWKTFVLCQLKAQEAQGLLSCPNPHKHLIYKTMGLLATACAPFPQLLLPPLSFKPARSRTR